jgi:HPt (histidine-containing phosphotransfer) domain-containing protein
MPRSNTIPRPLVHNEILDELRSAIDAADLEVILSVFRTDADAQLNDLKVFASSGNHDAARRLAHRLAGLLAQFGAKAASELAHHLAASTSNPGDAAAIEAIVSTCRAAVAEICESAVAEPDSAPAPLAPALKPAPKQITGRPFTLPPQMAAEVVLKATLHYPTHRRRSEASPPPDG